VGDSLSPKRPIVRVNGGSGRPPAGFVQGMDKTFVKPDWPPLRNDEVRAVLRQYERIDGAEVGLGAVITWRSPRPMSGACLVRWKDQSVFVKRHHASVRTPLQLRVEHAFTDHLRACGQRLPAVLRNTSEDTVVQSREFIYEVHERAHGIDLYRDVPSWHPFTSLDHARATGHALAQFHLAARDFARPPRAPGVLMSSVAIVSSADPITELRRLLLARPALARAVASHSFEEDVTCNHLDAINVVAPLLNALDPQWGHGDWHPSNLTWTSAAPTATVSGVLDLGLANRTFAVHDLAVAIERSTVDWLDLAEVGHVVADLAAVDAVLRGYEDVRPLEALEVLALVALLPVVHFEYALSEVEYFAAVVDSEVNTQLAYDSYLVGHARWYTTADGSILLEHLRRYHWRGGRESGH
jgi:Ser/Thr protein kinase RdoA (MazF antagonist)